MANIVGNNNENDTLQGTEETDTLSGLSGDDQLSGNKGFDFLYGNEGNDTLFGGLPAETQTNTDVNGDLLFGGDGNDQLNGQRGNDNLQGDLGNDSLNGGDGNDSLFANKDNDSLRGGNGEDFLFGESGNDSVFGESGSDRLVGGRGDDSLDGGKSNDRLFGDSREIFTNEGHQYFLTEIASWQQAQEEAESYGGDLVTINDADEQNWLVETFGNGERFWIGLSDQETEGEFKWSSGETPDYTNWGDGQPDDGNGGEDYVAMNFTAPGNWNDFGSNRIYAGIVEVNGTGAIPTLDGKDTLFGGAGKDSLYGDGGRDSLTGGASDDLLVGGSGNDTLTGDKGRNQKDTFIGGAGRDLIVLGTRSTIFYDRDQTRGFGTIRQFANGDKIQLKGAAGDYSLNKDQSYAGNRNRKDTAIFTASGDLIGVIQDNTNLVNSLDSNFFAYV